MNDQNVTTNYTYNNLNELTKETTKTINENETNQATGEPIDETNYKYDLNGNLVEKQDKERTLKYNYTVEDRLSAVKDGNQVLMAAIYDGNGDRVFTISPKQKQRPEKNTENINGNTSSNEEDKPQIAINMPHTGGNKSILVYILYLLLAVVILLMLKSKSKKLQKTGIATVLVTIVATSVIMIMPKQEESTESIYAYCENPEKASEPRQINEDMIFIPLGINKQDEEEYELTQYINDVTSQNTQVLMQYSNNGQDKIAYNYGNERLSYEVTKQDENLQTSTQNYTYNYDGRGSVTNVLDNSSKSVLQYSYNAFGETTINGKTAKEVAQENANAYQGTPDETLANTYQFNAEDTNNLTGLQYLRARYYDSQTGRFTTEDTYKGRITDPLTRNLYLYTNNDPVNYVDPSGHWLSGLLKIADTVAKVISPTYRVVSKIASNIGNALIHSQNRTVSNIARRVKNVVEDTINRIDANSYRESQEEKARKDRVSKFIEIKKQEPVYRGAAINPKVEKSIQLEGELNYWRKQNTTNAGQMIKILQEKMKLECESSLSRISNKQIQNYTKTPTERIKESIKVTYSTAAGTTVGAVSNFIGGNMGLGYGIAKAIDTQNVGNVFEGMKEFNEQYVNPVNNKIKKMVSTNDTAYDIGYIAGNFAPAVASFYMAGSTLTTVPTTLETFTSTMEAGTGVATLGKVVSVTIPIVTSEAPALTVATSTTGATSAMQIASGGLNGGNGTGGSDKSDGCNKEKTFKNQSLLEEHYEKHGQEIADVLEKSKYPIDKYLDDANYIINNGTYVPELNGYVRFISGKKYGFVGLDNATGNITTFHIKNVSELIKKAPSLGFER